MNAAPGAAAVDALHRHHSTRAARSATTQQRLRRTPAMLGDTYSPPVQSVMLVNWCRRSSGRRYSTTLVPLCAWPNLQQQWCGGKRGARASQRCSSSMLCSLLAAGSAPNACSGACTCAHCCGSAQAAAHLCVSTLMDVTPACACALAASGLQQRDRPTRCRSACKHISIPPCLRAKVAGRQTS